MGLLTKSSDKYWMIKKPKPKPTAEVVPTPQPTFLQKCQSLWTDLSTFGKTMTSVIPLITAVSAIYLYLELPVPASVRYVDNRFFIVDDKVGDASKRIELVQNETQYSIDLNFRNNLQREKFDIERTPALKESPAFQLRLQQVEQELRETNTRIEKNREKFDQMRR